MHFTLSDCTVFKATCQKSKQIVGSIVYHKFGPLNTLAVVNSAEVAPALKVSLRASYCCTWCLRLSESKR